MTGEVDITAGYYMFAKLGKGLGLIGIETTNVADTDTIITPFVRCVPVVTPAITGATADSSATLSYVAEDSGTITFHVGTGATLPTKFHVLIMGAMY